MALHTLFTGFLAAPGPEHTAPAPVRATAEDGLAARAR